ncbi:NAD(P)/FAD-dependent oxidoreductase [Tropicimonas sp. IMCC34011]|uniref:FAD/NAD(P)-dependent oxidoreductase n=1 Tax=Tropicimonas sp. IMCC34011 TaxID=2248759 RepID=UPI000E249A4A|nr:FAD/NAD(P)-binding oxidoreductase [Tropicimonas sp. IMCC34011]
MTSETADLVVIGAGPAGLAAACEARELGMSVVVLDEQTAPGGQIYRNIESVTDDRQDVLGPDYVAGQELAAAFRRSGAEHCGGATVWNLTTDGVVDYIADGPKTVSGKYVLLASGAMERPFPIKGWTLPGVMGAGAAQVLLKGAGAVPAGPVTMVGSGPLLYLLAWQYMRAGVRIAVVVDTTPMTNYLRAVPKLPGALAGWPDLSKGLKLLGALRKGGVKVYRDAREVAIEGRDAAQAVTFRHRGGRIELPARLVLLHQGVVPNVQLSMSTGLDHSWDAAQHCWTPVTDEWGRMATSSLYVAGDSRGISGALASAVQGRLAALSIGQQLEKLSDLQTRAAPLRRQLKRYMAIRPFLDTLYCPREIHRVPTDDDVMVCRCEEVTAGQIRGYVKLGCLGPNQTKAFGRCGMGPCQGRFCGVTVTELIAKERKVDCAEVGHYRIRPPIKPILLRDLSAPKDEEP